MVLKLTVAAVVVYIALCAALFVFQRTLIYFPQPRAPVSGARRSACRSRVGECWSRRGARRPDALLYFGGNAEDVSHNLPGLAAALPDHAIYLMHYRGYGGSAGQPSEAALVADAVALFDRVHAEHARIVVVGRSLGSGVAVQLASHAPGRAAGARHAVRQPARPRCASSSPTFRCAGCCTTSSSRGATRSN